MTSTAPDPTHVRQRAHTWRACLHALRVLTLAPLVFLVACAATEKDDINDNPPQLAAATPGALSTACADLATKLSFANTRITAASAVAAGTLKVAGVDVPAHCLVTGRMFERTSTVDNQPYAIGFEMRLPIAWNGRFFHQGNGGIDGNVSTATGAFGGGPNTHALLQGFAVLSSDAGHTAAVGSAFGIDPQARLDYGYQAVAKLTPMAKAVIQTSYGKGPDRSYFGGCSNGGRHALVTAARLPADYDGIVAGAPGFNLPKAAVANIAGAQRLNAVTTVATDLGSSFTAAERATLSAAVVAKCDALDGATDGLVQDTGACQTVFKLSSDVRTCTGARDGSCLSAPQKAAIGPIFSGVTTSSGALVYSSFPYDSGHGAPGVAFWKFTAPLVLDSGAVGQIFKVPPEPVVGFNGPAFSLGANIDTLVAQINATNTAYAESGLAFMTPPSPSNLFALKNRGGKIIAYHGVSDAIFSVNDTTRWADELNTAQSGRSDNFARVFRVPGMGHCSGGPATDQFDLVTAIVNWVEKNQAPDSITANARGAGNAAGANADLPAAWSANRSRPLCPYPKVARYKGSGDVEVAANFSCL